MKLLSFTALLTLLAPAKALTAEQKNREDPSRQPAFGQVQICKSIKIRGQEKMIFICEDEKKPVVKK